MYHIHKFDGLTGGLCDAWDIDTDIDAFLQSLEHDFPFVDYQYPEKGIVVATVWKRRHWFRIFFKPEFIYEIKETK